MKRRSFLLVLVLALTLASAVGTPLHTNAAQQPGPPELLDPALAVSRLVLEGLLPRDPWVISRQLVRLNLELLGGPVWDPRLAPPDGTEIGLRLSGDLRLTVIQTRISLDMIGSYSWFAATLGDPNGYASFVVVDGIVTGDIQYLGRLFQIRYAGAEDLHFLQEIDADQLRVDGDDTLIPPRFPRSRRRDRESAGNNPDARATIDVLGVYTTAAKNGAGGDGAIRGLLQGGVNDANAAFGATEIGASLRLVATYEVTYNEAGDLATILRDLTNTGDGRMDAVHDWRNSHGADLVALIAERRDSDAVGRGWLMTSVSSAFRSWAFSVTSRGYVRAPVYTLAHEIGHNLGGHHDRYVTNDAGAYSYSHGYVDTANRFLTIMAYWTQCEDAGLYDCQKLRAFSAPNWTTDGAPIGDDGADNTRTIENTAGVAAGFYSAGGGNPPGAPRNLTVSVNGTSATLRWSAPSTGGAPTSYVVEVGRSSGASDYFVRSTTSTSYGISNLPAGTLYARVRAKNSSGTGPASNERSFTSGGGGGGSAPGAPRNLTVSTDEQSATLRWERPSSGGAVSTYLLEVGRSSGASGYFTRSLSSTTYRLMNMPAGTFYARVRARNQYGTSPPSNERTFEIEEKVTEPPGATRVYRPTTKSNLARPELQWAETAGAETFEIRVRDGGTQIYAKTVRASEYCSEGGNCFITKNGMSPGPLQDKTYNWLIRGVNRFGAGPWTTTTFQVKKKKIATKPKLTSPGNDASVVPTVVLRWKVDEYTNMMKLVLRRPSTGQKWEYDLNSVQFCRGVDSCGAWFSDGLAAGQWSWQIVPCKGGTCRRASRVRTFRVRSGSRTVADPIAAFPIPAEDRR